MSAKRRYNRPILIALAVIAVVFGAYEIAERTLLKGADPLVIHYLHLARGVVTSLLVAIVLVLYFVKRFVPTLPLRGDKVSELDRDGGDAILIQRSRWLVRTRWVVVLVLGSTVLVLGFLLDIVPPGSRTPLLGTTGALAALNIVFERLVQKHIASARVIGAQMVTDLLFLSVVLHFSSGLENPLVWLTSLHVVLAGILLERWQAFVVAGAACAFVVVLAIGGSTGMLMHHPIPWLATPEGTHLACTSRYAATVAIAVCALIAMMTVLTSSIRATLRSSERDLLQAYKMAAIGRLSAGVAHEINNPLAVASARVKLMLEEGAEAPVRGGLEVVERQIDRMTAIVRGMLDYARPSAGGRKAIDLSQVVRGVIMGVRPTDGKNVRIEQDLSKTPLTIEANASQIAQIVVNLVGNALEAMPAAGGMIRISTLAEDGVALLRVEDTGVGMSREVQERIFEPFFTTKSERGGTGLGLAIVKGLVQAHGGEIDVSSQVGQGTRFDIRFPRRCR